MRFKAGKHNTLEVYSVNNSHRKQLSLNVLRPHVFSPRAVLSGFQDYMVCYVIVTKCPTTRGRGGGGGREFGQKKKQYCDTTFIL